MDIKNNLKELNITQSDFASCLRLSRPTLGAYIEVFEKGEAIQKEKYNIIFHALFDNKLSKEEFQSKLDTYAYMLERDDKMGVTDLSPTETDKVTTIVNNVIQDLKQGNYSEDIYSFIVMILNNYRREKLFKLLAEYFVALNTDCEIRDDQKRYFANFYKMMSTVKNNPDNYNCADYEAFLQRREQVNAERMSHNEELKKAMLEKADKILKDASLNGMKLTAAELASALGIKED